MRGQSCGVSRQWPGPCRSCIGPSLGQDCQRCPQCPRCLLLPRHLPPQRRSQESDLPLHLPPASQQVLLWLLPSPRNWFRICPSGWCCCGPVNDRLLQECLQTKRLFYKQSHTRKLMHGKRKIHTLRTTGFNSHVHISTTGYSGVLLRSLSLSLSFSSLMGRQEPSVKYSISSMSSLVSFRISDSSLQDTLLLETPHTKKKIKQNQLEPSTFSTFSLLKLKARVIS